MVTTNDSAIVMTALAVAVGSFFGWHVFSALNDLLPFMQNQSPILRLGVGLGGIWLLVRLGLRKQD